MGGILGVLELGGGSSLGGGNSKLDLLPTTVVISSYVSTLSLADTGAGASLAVLDAEAWIDPYESSIVDLD